MNSTISDLYNPEVKERFLSTVADEGGDVKKVLGHLKKFAPVERKYGVDIAQMDIDEAIMATQELGIRSTSTLKNTLVSTRKYAKWCVSGNIFPNCNNGFVDIRSSDVKFSSPNIFFMNEDDLLNSLHQVCSFDEGKPEVPYIIFCWLGLSKELSVSLKDLQVDLSRKEIYAPDGSVIVHGMSDGILDALEQYVNCRRSIRPNGVSKKQVMKDMSVDTFIKRMISVNSYQEDSFAGIPYDTGSLDSLVTRLNQKYKELHPGCDKITPSNAIESGRLFRLYMKECEVGEDVTSPRNKKVFDDIMRVSEKSHRSDYINKYRKYREARRKLL